MNGPQESENWSGHMVRRFLDTVGDGADVISGRRLFPRFAGRSYIMSCGGKTEYIAC